MFEGILERVLQRALGDYIEGLNQRNLSLGVRSVTLKPLRFGVETLT